MGLGYYEVGGFTSVVNTLVKYLQRQGVEVVVGARIVRVKPPNWVNLMKLTPREFAREALKYDVVHIHLSYPYIKAVLKANYSCLVVTHHGYVPWRIVPGFKNKMVHLYLRFAYRALLSSVPCIVAISNYVKEQLKKLYGLNAIVIHNGVDIEVFRPMRVKRDSSYPIIFNATAWNRFKGADLLLEHFAILKEQYPEAKLIARGLPIFSHWVRKFLGKTGLKPEKDIEVLPYLSYEKLPYYYNLADFYLLTSRWESFSLPILESFACGTPVVAYAADDARREHINNSKAGVLYESKESLLQAVEDVLKYHATYSQKATGYAKKFHWENVAQEYIKVYNRVTS